VTERENDRFLAEQFSRYLEKLADKNHPDLPVAAGDEFEGLLMLSKVMLETDWSKESNPGLDQERRKRLETVWEEEISEEELDWVAGGLKNQEYRLPGKEDED
jgi:hypothetical protein